MYPLGKKQKDIENTVNTIILSAPNHRTGGHQVEPRKPFTKPSSMHFQRLVYYKTQCHVERNNENGKLEAFSVHVSGEVFGQII